jgi:RNA polymerase sigma factor (TIGR02999 family)
MASTAERDPAGVTQLLLSWSGGHKSALDELIPLVYRELRRLAAGYLRRERPDHTMQPTALVHEAYVRLVDQSVVDCRSRSQFFAIAANLMRQVLVNHAHSHRAVKRGGGNKVTLEDAAMLTRQPGIVDVLVLDEALTKLAQLDPEQSRIVELRFFCGLTQDEIADVLKLSSRTVKRDWLLAKAWLHGELGHGELKQK